MNTNKRLRSATEVRPFQGGELDRLMVLARQRPRVGEQIAELITWTLQTGARCSTSTRACWRDVDWDTRTWRAEFKYRERRVHLSSEAIDTLKRLRELAPADEERIFHQLSPALALLCVERLLARSGSAPISFYHLRLLAAADRLQMRPGDRVLDVMRDMDMAAQIVATKLAAHQGRSDTPTDRSRRARNGESA